MVKTLPSNAEGMGLIPCQGAKLPRASRPKNQNIKQKQFCNKFNKDFKNGPYQKKKTLKKKKNQLALLCDFPLTPLPHSRVTGGV